MCSGILSVVLSVRLHYDKTLEDAVAVLQAACVSTESVQV